MKAEGAYALEGADNDVKAQDTFVSPKKPLPGRTEELNGMEE